jgi:hypothetical protein
MRVERQRIGVSGDGVDQFDDLAEAGRGLGQLADAIFGLFRLRHCSLAMRAESCIWRLILLTEDAISPVAEATDCTLVEASSDTAARPSIH